MKKSRDVEQGMHPFPADMYTEFAKSLNLDGNKCILGNDDTTNCKTALPANASKLTGSSFLYSQGSSQLRSLSHATRGNIVTDRENMRKVIYSRALFEERETVRKEEEHLISLRASFRSAFTEIPSATQPEALYATKTAPVAMQSSLVTPLQVDMEMSPKKRERSDAICEDTPHTSVKTSLAASPERTHPRFMPLRVISSPDVGPKHDKEGKPVKRVTFGGLTVPHSPSYEELVCFSEEVIFKPVVSKAAYPRKQRKHKANASKTNGGNMQVTDYSASLSLHFAADTQASTVVA
jgi:hypothetical protein